MKKQDKRQGRQRYEEPCLAIVTVSSDDLIRTSGGWDLQDKNEEDFFVGVGF